MKGDAPLTLYHGSPRIVEGPSLEQARPHNDYGKGFYCTTDLDRACEWACKHGEDGFANRYALDAANLHTLDLLDGTHSALEWIALLLANRTFALRSAIAVDARRHLLDRFLIDTSPYDVIIGYRADDSYFSYAKAFVENALPLSCLTQALYLGKLGTQTVLVSPRAFDALTFVDALTVDARTFYPRFAARDEAARREFYTLSSNAASYRDDLFIMDILREGIGHDDSRLQRMVSA